MMPAIQTRLLLCRAQGGLNDILSEIGRCLNYARKYNRTVIVETDYFDLNHFNDCFGNYFISHDQRLILDSKSYRQQFDQLSCFPKFVEGRVNSYRCFPDTVGIDLETKQPVVVDFTKDYTEILLVHHSNARQKGRNALDSLKVLQLQPSLLATLKIRLKSLGENYKSVHIRHTDYKTEYENRVRSLKAKLDGTVFIATDNADVLATCEKILDESQVLSFSKLPDDAGAPLHHLRGPDNAKQRNDDAILDLFTLVHAQEYFFFPRQTNSFALRPTYSGFSVLVDRLRHEPRLLQQILTGNTDTNLPNGNWVAAKLRQLIGR
jgi:hypothetical protein